MHTGVCREQSVRELARHEHGCALQSRFLAWLIVDDLAPESAAFGPAEIHAQQHLRPVLRLGASRAWMDRQNRVLAVVLAAEHLLDLAGLHFLIEHIERFGEFRVNGLARFRPFDEDGEIVGPLLQRAYEVLLLLETPPALQDTLGLGLVLPEIGRGGPRLETTQFFV